MAPVEEKLAHNRVQGIEAELPLQRLSYPEFWPLTTNYIYLAENRRVVVHASASFESDDFYNALFLHTWVGLDLRGCPPFQLHLPRWHLLGDLA